MDFFKSFIQVVLGGQMLGTQCSSLGPPAVLGAHVVNMSAVEVHGFRFPPVLFNPTEINDLDFCNVSVALSHTGANDTVYVNVWLPLADWNGRYQATGGGGLSAGIGAPMLARQVENGYAASSTDGGLTMDNTINPQSGAWALKADGSPNNELILNFAWRSIHDMAVISKDLIQQFYGVGPTYSYWHGCSQGGRQGYAAAAKYPHDFDGVLAIAPALDIAELGPASLWPPVVMQNSNEVPPFCVFEAYQKAVMAACDPLDGVKDGMISDYEVIENCPFDAQSLVGTEIPCEEECMEYDPQTLNSRQVPCLGNKLLKVTSAHADIANNILTGPVSPDGKRLWYGLPPGASFSAIANTTRAKNGTRIPLPFPTAENWVKFLALQDRNYDVSAMTYTDYFEAYEASVSKQTSVWGNGQLDLTDFRRKGGKLLTWFGLADAYIPPSGTLRYREGVEEKFGGSETVDEFYRLFLAPGVGHCFGGVGPAPVDPLGALVSWVENGTAPDVLPASIVNEDNIEVTRDLCRHPKKLVYKGGDINSAHSFSCE